MFWALFVFFFDVAAFVGNGFFRLFFFVCGDSFGVAADLFFGLFLFCCVGVDAVLAVVLVGLFFFFVAGELGKKEFSDMIKQFNGLFDNQYVPASCAPSAASGQS